MFRPRFFIKSDRLLEGGIAWIPPVITKPCDRSLYDVIRDEMEDRCGLRDAGGCADSRRYDGAVVASHILIRGMSEVCYDGALITMVHELLHALGIPGHVDSIFTKSVLRKGLWGNCRFEIALLDWYLFVERGEVIEMDVLYRLDRDALKAIYSLENGDYSEELRIEPEEECQ